MFKKFVVKKKFIVLWLYYYCIMVFMVLVYNEYDLVKDIGMVMLLFMCNIVMVSMNVFKN